MNTGVELQGRYYDKKFMNITDRMCKWYEGTGIKNTEALLKVESRDERISYDGGACNESYIVISLEFFDIDLYRLFQLTFNRSEYDWFITSETQLISAEELEHWKND